MAKTSKVFELKTELELYDKAVDLVDGLQRLGKTMPYTASNTHMFSILTKDGRLGIRLSKESREVFNKDKEVKIFKNYGATMREYVEIPAQMLQNSKLVADLLQQAWNYVNDLPPRKDKKK